MGGRTQRPSDHAKAPLVEDALAIDLVELRRADLLEPGEPFTMTWSRDGAPLVTVAARVVEAGGRKLLMAIQAPDRELLRVVLDLAPFEPHLGGVRWFLRCPLDGCTRRVVKLYLAPGMDRVGCRLCLGLAHRSAQEHDKRVDLARRDPIGFRDSRRHLTSSRSRLVTAWLVIGADRASESLRSGRRWAKKSMTSRKRASDADRAD